MTESIKIFILFFFLATLSLPSCSEHTNKNAKKKKIIEYGWDIPDANYIKQNIREMELKPFDGIIFMINNDEGITYAFDVNQWCDEDFISIQGIEWGVFTDNFLMMWCTNKYNMDWFNDTHWQVIEKNMEIIAKSVMSAGCKGIAIDPELYTETPAWQYNSTLYPDKTFTEVEAKVRERGKQFISALQRGFPDIKIFTLFLFSCIELSAIPEGTFQDTHYALYKAFAEGMLINSAGNTQIIDGVENAYYFSETNRFFDFNTVFRSDEILSYIVPEARENYLKHGRFARALYMDYILNNVENQNFPAEYCYKWWQHNVYYSLATSDEYVWCYSEEMNWWTGNIFSGGEDGIKYSKKLYDSSLAAGFDMYKPDPYDTVNQAEFISSPVIEILSPRNNTFINKELFNRLSFSIKGNPVPVNNQLYINAVLNDESSSYIFNPDLTDVISNNIIIYIRSFDENGRHVTSSPLNLNLIQ